MGMPRVVTVLSRTPDVRGRFPVLLDGGWMASWPIDRIRWAASEGVRIEERGAA